MRYNVRYVHKINPKDTDVGDPLEISTDDLRDRRALGARLRAGGAFWPGAAVCVYRVEGMGTDGKAYSVSVNGAHTLASVLPYSAIGGVPWPLARVTKIVVFPASGIWWSLVLTPAE